MRCRPTRWCAPWRARRCRWRSTPRTRRTRWRSTGTRRSTLSRVRPSARGPWLVGLGVLACALGAARAAAAQGLPALEPPLGVSAAPAPRAERPLERGPATPGDGTSFADRRRRISREIGYGYLGFLLGGGTGALLGLTLDASSGWSVV